MKILITGGNGFIARNLSEQLREDFAVISQDRKGLDLLDSAGVFNYLKSNRFDAVIHAATYDAVPKHSGKDPAKVLEYNLKMFFNIARCSDFFGKMIYFGSGAEFGRENWEPKMKEDYFGRHIPQDQYGFSKYIMAKHAQASRNIYNLRLFAVFGRYEDWRVRFISNICYCAMMGLPVRIDQNKYYDFLYIDDLVKVVRWFIENEPKHKAYNVSSGAVADFRSIAGKVVGLAKSQAEIRIAREGLGAEYSADNSLLLSEMKSLTFTALDDSIRQLYEWYRANKRMFSDDGISVSGSLEDRL